MLGEIAEMINGTLSVPRQELARGVSINSVTTRPGDLFFALKGSRTDGHEFVTDALRRGAAAAVVDNGHPGPGRIQVRETLFALGELARNYRRRLRVRTIGITGTNGKTTVKNLVKMILSRKNQVIATDRNYNSLIGLPLTILNATGDEDFMILEMGTSAPGEIRRLCDIAKPSIGIITNIGPGHLEGLGSIDGVRKEKMALIDALPDDGIGVVGEGIHAGGRINVADFSSAMLEKVNITESGSHFTLDAQDFNTQLLGAGNVYNCLAAIFLTSRLGVDRGTQSSAIADIEPEPGRMVPVRVNGLLIIDDTYNANPFSVKAAIDFMTCSERRKIIVLGDMLELGERSRSLHHEVGMYAKERTDLLLTLGSEAKHYEGRNFNDANGLLRFLVNEIKGDEILLFKASRRLRFELLMNALVRLIR